MFEHRSQPVVPPRRFVARVLGSLALVFALTAVSLAAGMVGYHALEGLAWMDAFLNAAMLLGGMGPVTTPLTEGGKLFAGIYALYCGLVVIVAAGILLAPAAHRLLHKFHLENSRSARPD
jgi:hypothetical protein